MFWVPVPVLMREPLPVSVPPNSANDASAALNWRRASNCTARRREKVVFPEEDGPEINTRRACFRRSAICRAISAIVCSCSASETRMISRLRPASTASSSAPTLEIPSRSSQAPYWQKASRSFWDSTIGPSFVGVCWRG